MKPLKIVHTSDVHLDSRVKDARDARGFRSRAEEAFAGVMETTLEECADVLLIVGDLFDNNRVDDSNIEFVYRQLERTPSRVILIPGNHDVHDERSVWERFDVREAGDHVYALTDHNGETLLLESIKTRFWGKGMLEHIPENYPLEGIPARMEGYWNIGLAHGQVCTRRIGQGSSPILSSEIRESGLDYLALGHIHVWGEHSEGDTVAHYCGSPVAHYAGAQGGKVAIVSLCPEEGVAVTPRQVSNRDEAEGAEANPAAG